MIIRNRASLPSRGFSLLEVMIAVVVLATGLLALAALQGSLTRSSADAKVRGRVAALLAARLDEVRSMGYGAIVSSTDSCATNEGNTDGSNWVPRSICTQTGLGTLVATQTVTEWSGTGSFTQTAPADPDDAQFKRVDLSATWSDAAGGSHRLAMASDISSLGLSSNLIPPPEDQSAGSSGPVVRTINPATAGVIPIALGNSGSSTAASNPTPELVGQGNNQSIVGTKFNVLTYTPPAGNAVVIQKRFENELIKCTCQYGAGGTNLPEIYRTAQWPAIWTGERYEVYKPDSPVNAPGQTYSSGPKAGVTQSALCQECCRDHHDDATSGVAKFDPERALVTGESTGREKYDLNNQNALTIVPNTNNATYINACRVIRVDGFWRTASDMYSRQFGLLETQTVSGLQAKSGLPTSAATTAYTNFVKDYLAQYNGTTGTAPTNAQTMYDDTARGLNNPSLVTIATASNSDYRYLHARGLYVDYLEAKARQKLVDVLATNCPGGVCPTGTVADYILPYLPFTSANLTEIAKWLASNTSVLTVNSGNLLATDPSQPSGSRTLGKVVGTSDNTGSIRRSNSGVAVNTGASFTGFDGVDPGDNTTIASDAQPFQVGGIVNTGPTFDVRVSGGGLNPFVFFTMLTDIDKECLKPAGGDHRCVTATGTVLPQAGSIKLANYGSETNTARSVTATCTKPNGSTVSVTQDIDVPTFNNYFVDAASINGSPGTIGAPVNDNRTTETTTITFGSIPANGLVLVTLAAQTGSPTYATVQSCTTNGAGTTLVVTAWNKPWLP